MPVAGRRRAPCHPPPHPVHPNHLMIHRSDEDQCALFEESSKTNGMSKRKRPAGDAPKPADFGLTAPSQVVKNYVLDTNVLLHDPASLERFKGNTR